jgi:hypothetical protein
MMMMMMKMNGNIVHMIMNPNKLTNNERIINPSI